MEKINKKNFPVLLVQEMSMVNMLSEGVVSYKTNSLVIRDQNEIRDILREVLDSENLTGIYFNRPCYGIGIKNYTGVSCPENTTRRIHLTPNTLVVSLTFLSNGFEGTQEDWENQKVSFKMGIHEILPGEED